MLVEEYVDDIHCHWLINLGNGESPMRFLPILRPKWFYLVSWSREPQPADPNSDKPARSSPGQLIFTDLEIARPFARSLALSGHGICFARSRMDKITQPDNLCTHCGRPLLNIMSGAHEHDYDCTHGVQ